MTKRDRGVIVEPSLLPPYPIIEKIEPPAEQPAARLGETLTLTGHHLDGTGAVAGFVHRLIDPIEIPIGVSANAKQIDVALPSGGAAGGLAAGLYTVTVSLVGPPTLTREDQT